MTSSMARQPWLSPEVFSRHLYFWQLFPSFRPLKYLGLFRHSQSILTGKPALILNQPKTKIFEKSPKFVTVAKHQCAEPEKKGPTAYPKQSRQRRKFEERNFADECITDAEKQLCSSGGFVRRIAFMFRPDDINAMTRQNYLRAASVAKKERQAPVANKEANSEEHSILKNGKLTDVTRFERHGP
ncbi:hypothetical protein TNCV_1721821 [Trichonephila clavipes]|nr:hypothetical protein TNCV_1721821 [Trichonephila clavipes]